MTESLEPTYKELKPLENIATDPHVSGLEPTYKELKHLTAGGSWGGEFRLEPTYKELKLWFFKMRI